MELPKQVQVSAVFPFGDQLLLWSPWFQSSWLVFWVFTEWSLLLFSVKKVTNYLMQSKKENTIIMKDINTWLQGWFADSVVSYFFYIIKAAGYTIGIVGDNGIRANAQQEKLFVGLILILIFGEALALYGLIVSLILVSWVYTFILFFFFSLKNINFNLYQKMISFMIKISIEEIWKIYWYYKNT